MKKLYKIKRIEINWEIDSIRITHIDGNEDYTYTMFKNNNNWVSIEHYAYIANHTAEYFLDYANDNFIKKSQSNWKIELNEK